MDPALRVAATGMAAQQLRVDAIAHNLANVNTTAFKRSDVHFEDLLYQQMQGARIVSQPGADVLPAVQLGRGVRVVSNSKIHTQGAIEQTGAPLDVAIEGEGYFPVQLPDGSTAYTRDGHFQISDKGLLVTGKGYALSPGISVPSDVQQITISPNGEVTGSLGSGKEAVSLGRIELARFVNPDGLEAMGENLYHETPASGQAFNGNPQEEGYGQLEQGSLESSNVEVVQEMVNMIAAQRAFETNGKVITTSEDMMDRANGLIR